MSDPKKTILGSYGVMNDIQPPPTPSYEAGYLNSLKQAANNLHTPDVLTNKTEFKAVVLRVDSDGKPSKAPSSHWSILLAGLLGVSGEKRVIVRARIPELHAALPIPESESDHGIIELYPQFSCSPEVYQSPGVGNIIKVTFGNIITQKDPAIISKESGGNSHETLDIFSTQKGCIDATQDSLKVEPSKGEKIVQSNVSRITTPTKDNSWEIKTNRNNIQRTLESCGVTDSKSVVTTSNNTSSSESSPVIKCQVSFKMSDVSDPNLDSPPSTPLNSPPAEGKYAVYSTWNGRKRGEEEMIRHRGKLVMAKSVYPSFKQMSASALLAGIKLQLNSGFRTFDEQLNLRRKNVINKSKVSDKKYLINKRPQRGNFKPLTAEPGKSNHQSGTAIDLQTGMPRGGPHPSKITKMWRWLANNAHKHGFVRTVKSERWHFVYVGVSKAAAKRFQKVPRGHASWDGMF